MAESFVLSFFVHLSLSLSLNLYFPWSFSSLDVRCRNTHGEIQMKRKRKKERWNRKKMIKRLKMIPDVSFLSPSLTYSCASDVFLSLSLSHSLTRKRTRRKRASEMKDDECPDTSSLSWIIIFIHFFFPFLSFNSDSTSFFFSLSLSLVTSSLVDRKWSLEMWFKDRTNVIRPRRRERVSKCPSGRDRIQGMWKEESHKEAGKKS